MHLAELAPKTRPLLIAAFALLAALVVLSLAHPGATAASGTASAAAPATDCWLAVSNPNPDNGNSALQAVTAVSTNDVWAVGYSTVNTSTYAFIEHWNGTDWTIVPSPNPGSQTNILHGVSALSSNNVWAVGSSDNQPLVLHWNGVQWIIVPSVTISGGGALSGVATISANDIWAVGSAGNSTLTMHWNGAGWLVVPSPNPAPGNSLASVSAVSSTDVWAVGNLAVLRWDGTSWTSLPNDLPTSMCWDPYASYTSVSARTSNDVWAVGYCSGHAFDIQAYAGHWDGTQWTITTGLGHVADGNLELNSVIAVAADDVWAVGTIPNNQVTRQLPWVKHWDGTNWSDVTAADPGGADTDLYGVTSTGGDDLWAVGSYQDASSTGRTLTERHYATCPPSPPCPGQRFTDVCPGDYFYTATLALADDGILSGYSTSPPCLNSLWIPCFNPYANITRGQIAKVASLAAGFHEPVSGQTFYDVPPGSTFYTYTERMASRHIMVGYTFGDGHCPQQNLPCFLPNRFTTRGQLSKVMALTFGFNDPVTGQAFEDVQPGSTFYTYVAQLSSRGIINGYPCGGPGEPCVPPGNLPYFRPNANVTRGQTAKIVQLARTQPTPTPTATPTLTPTPILTATAVSTAVPPTTDTAIPDLTSTPTVTSTLTTR